MGAIEIDMVVCDMLTLSAAMAVPHVGSDWRTRCRSGQCNAMRCKCVAAQLVQALISLRRASTTGVQTKTLSPAACGRSWV